MLRASESQPPPQLQTWEPTRPQRTRLSRPTRPPPLPSASQHPQSVRFRPDVLRQPELLRQLEVRNSQLVRPRQPTASQNPRPKSVTTLKPYQLKPKRGQETFIEPPVEQKEVPPPSKAKQIKRMKKKLLQNLP